MNVGLGAAIDDDGPLLEDCEGREVEGDERSPSLTEDGNQTESSVLGLGLLSEGVRERVSTCELDLPPPMPRLEEAATELGDVEALLSFISF